MGQGIEHEISPEHAAIAISVLDQATAAMGVDAPSSKLRGWLSSLHPAATEADTNKAQAEADAIAARE